MQLFLSLLCNPTRGAAPYCDIRFLLAKDSGAAAQVCQKYTALGFLYVPPLEPRQFQTLIDTLKIPASVVLHGHYHAFIPEDYFFLPLGRHLSREDAIAHGRDKVHKHIAIVLSGVEALALSVIRGVLDQDVYEFHHFASLPPADSANTLSGLPMIKRPFSRMRV